LEAGVGALNAGRELGGRKARADAIVRFALENPEAITAENSLFSHFLLGQMAADTKSKTGAEKGTPVSLSNVSPPVPLESGSRSPNRVFVVHGRNEQARDEVVSYLDRVGMEGIVLHDQPNMGRHLLTKFIGEAKLVTFAVVLMTDDDVGSAKGGTQAPRARQNVILELGYFLAHLGQAKVCALITPGLETPSDFDGIVYIKMAEDQKWKAELLRELYAAKMPVRMDRLGQS
jgi:predicted nucleotide-binding protein